MTDAMKVKDALLPCPFCGGKAEIADKRPKRRTYVTCLSCDTCTRIRENADEATKHWNTRSPSPATLDPVTVEAWQPIETAPKDGTPILVRLKNPLPEPQRTDLDRWCGVTFVARHNGLARDGFDIGWQFAAPVGQGGFPDRWIAGWQPLPSVSSTVPASSEAREKEITRLATLAECAKVIADLRQSEAGLTDSLHSGLAGASRSDALGDAHDAIRALAGPYSQTERGQS